MRGGVPVTSVRLLENRREPPHLREWPAHRGEFEWTPPPRPPALAPFHAAACYLHREGSRHFSPVPCVGTFKSLAEKRECVLPACPLRSARRYAHFPLHFRLPAHDHAHPSHASIQNLPHHTLVLSVLVFVIGCMGPFYRQCGIPEEHGGGHTARNSRLHDFARRLRLLHPRLSRCVAQPCEITTDVSAVQPAN